MTVISPLDSQLRILNQVNHFSTHLRPAKAKPYVYTFAMITLLLVYHHDLHFMLYLFVIMWPPFHATLLLHHMCCCAYLKMIKHKALATCCY